MQTLLSVLSQRLFIESGGLNERAFQRAGWTKLEGFAGLMAAAPASLDFIMSASASLCVLRRIRMRSALFVSVYLYRVAPSLYNPNIGLVWWHFQHFFVSHQLHPVDGVGRVTVSVCVRVLFSAPNWRISVPDQPQASLPLHPSPGSYLLFYSISCCIWLKKKITPSCMLYHFLISSKNTIFFNFQL